MKTACILLLLGVTAIAASPFSPDKTDLDVHKTARALKNSNIPHELKLEQLANLKSMDRDLKQWKSAGASRREEISHDLHNRMATLKRMLAQSTGAVQDDMDLERDEPAVPSTTTMIADDLSALRSALASSSMSSNLKREMEQNLDTIKSDANKYASSSSASEKQRLSQALKLRVQALRDSFAADSSSKSLEENDDDADVDVASTETPVHNVFNDAESIRTAVEDSSMSAAEQSAVIANLEAIESDASEIESTTGVHKENLKQAMKLRIQALHQQISSTKKDEDAVMSHDNENDDDDNDNDVENDSDNKGSFVNGITSKLTTLKNTISGMNIPSASKAEANNNIRVMEQDLKKIQSGANVSNLKQALKLRMSALEEILVQEDNDNNKESDDVDDDDE